MPLAVAGLTFAAALLNDAAYGHFARPGIANPAASEMPPVLPMDFRGWGLVVMGILWLSGASACLFAVVAWFAVPDARVWLEARARQLAVRPLPALRALDLLAILMVWLSAMRILGLHVIYAVHLEGGELLAAGLLVSAAAMLLALAAAVFLAQYRARGPHGSNGIWPFWQLAAANHPRSLWHDIGLGLLAYPLMLWAVSLAVYLNQALVESLGMEPDQHILVSELARPQSVPVLLIFFALATAGAAFFEELLFRGILYNTLRRYLGAAAGACSAAVLFAAVHMVCSQLLGLFVLALILTWLYDYTGRLVSSIALHAVNNLVALLMALYAQRPPGP